MQYRIPQHLHKPHQILFFEADELVMVLVLFTLALMFGYVFWLLLFLIPYIYSKVKKKYPRGALRHVLYRIGLVAFRCAPTAFEKQFRE
ncbi:type IV conjugative transfer system protein TraL [Thermodesulfovibrio yellowstonii]|uniref:type IV conjugative transfer system protein TraL n=1 Tax=Thermodesulfovibrio yellowstonii TaxID=28262 RepID=UPI00048F2B5B|nr:type IV conjugative transfer system protein TraL [Thermodesulfovibrio islandicus]